MHSSLPSPLQPCHNNEPITLTESTQADGNQLHSATQTQASASTMVTPNRHNDPNTLTQNPEQLNPTTRQRTLLCDWTNDGWGDIHHYAHPQKHFRVVSKNVSTLNPSSLDMLAITTELQAMQASVFCAQETNTAWTPTTLNELQNQCRLVYPQHKLAISLSKE